MRQLEHCFTSTPPPHRCYDGREGIGLIIGYSNRMSSFLTHTIFIDGQAGTTGLQLAAWLGKHPRIRLLAVEERFRKDATHRAALMRSADAVALCLPDDAAKEAVDLAPDARFLDASTAHRVAKGWVYGLPELSPAQREALRGARRVANPGCYPTGFALSVRPLIEGGLLGADVPLRLHAVSGYSGGGKAMIAKYRAWDDPAWRTRPYALSLRHKHLPEMRRYTGTAWTPLFSPAVGHYHNGMVVQVGLFAGELGGAGARDVREVLAERYRGEPFVHVHDAIAEHGLEDGFLSPTGRNGSNHLDLFVFGHDAQVLIVSRYDNLGKGAAGAAVQNLNLMLGLPETLGLEESACPQ